MSRLFVLAFFAAALFAQLEAQQGQLDGSETVFTVLAAINASGYDADLDSPYNSPIRTKLREIIASKNLSSVAPLKKFFQDHRQSDSNAELSQYISYALTLEGPPNFKSRMKPEEVPTDARGLNGLSPLLAAFYQQAGIHQLWLQAQGAYQEMIGAYHAGVTQALFEANAYLRNPTSGFTGRRFQIFIDLLGAPNQIQTRSYKDDYFVVVTSSPEPRINDIRHAYLHYLLDPLSLRFVDQLERLKPLAELAAPAPALDEAYKNDLVLFGTECVIKAVEARLASGASNRQALVNEAVREGFVLTQALADGLAVYEKEQEALRLYFPDLLANIDLVREDKRLENVQFVSTLPAKKVTPPRSEPVLTADEQALAQAEDLYAKRDLDGARQSYLKVLDQANQPALHPKAYYGLARIAVLERNPELAEKLFQKTLEISPDNETKSWANLYLARLADAQGDRDEAKKYYEAVLAIPDAPESVKTAAQKGLAEPFQKNR